MRLTVRAWSYSDFMKASQGLLFWGDRQGVNRAGAPVREDGGGAETFKGRGSGSRRPPCCEARPGCCLPSREAVPERPRCILRAELRMENRTVEWTHIKTSVEAHAEREALGTGLRQAGSNTRRNQPESTGDRLVLVMECFRLFVDQGNNGGRRCVCRDGR